MTKKLKKSLGQNFLRDEGVLDEIIRTAEISSEDAVIEVGPGDGAMTARILAEGASVSAVEIDQDLIAALEDRFGQEEKFELINEDIRRFHLAAYLEQKKWSTYRVIANLPYYITSSIIRYFLETDAQPQDMMLMVQKEVGERICAKDGGHSKLSISVQYYGEPTYLFTVPSHAFEPEPQVDSCILLIDNITRTQTPEEEKQFFRTVRAGFAARRKTLVNNLANGFHMDKKDVTDLLTSSGLTPTMRAQELSVTQWKTLAQALADAV